MIGWVTKLIDLVAKPVRLDFLCGEILQDAFFEIIWQFLASEREVIEENKRSTLE